MSPAAVPGTVDSVFREALERYPQFRPRVLHTKPWVLLFENFLSPEEVDVLLEKGGHSFERSLAGDGVTPVRTSSTSWCNVRSCLSDPVVQAVRQRISNVTRVPWEYAEHLQLLKYEPGQFYREHHDQNSPRHSAWGPRLYTFFMYAWPGRVSCDGRHPPTAGRRELGTSPTSRRAARLASRASTSPSPRGAARRSSGRRSRPTTRCRPRIGHTMRRAPSPRASSTLRTSGGHSHALRAPPRAAGTATRQRP